MTPIEIGSLSTWPGLSCAVPGGSIYAFVILSNHLHVVLKTPQPNLAAGMQVFLSAYANVWARRHRFCGHVFQGRYRTE
jgi:putative transposase